MADRRFVALLVLATAALGCGVPTEQADTDAPIVAIISPAANATVGGLVIFAAQAIDGFGVAKVEFMVDGAIIGTDLSSPYSVNWQTIGAGDGSHALRVQATDFADNMSFTSISVTVDNSPN